MAVRVVVLVLLLCGTAQAAPWVYELDEATRQAAMGMLSRATSSPLHHFVQKLLRPGGSNITVVGLGGSFCHGLNMPNLAERYLDRVEARLRAWAPAANVRVINSCVGATTPSHTVICLDRYLLRDGVDLILVDYLGNMGTMMQSIHDGYVNSYEMLLRRLLMWPGNPALLQVHTMHPHPLSPSFAHGAEDPVNVLSQYYGVPFVSARNALWLKQQYPQPSSVTNMDIRDANDKFHYNARGHAYIADLIMTALENVATDLATHGNTGTANTIQPSLSLPLASQGNTASALQPISLPLPPALVAPHITDVRYLKCVLPDELSTLVVQKGEGWGFMADDKRRAKPGFVSLVLGPPLVLRVPAVALPGAVYDALIGYLKSYAGMGIAAITCSGGCTCERLVVDARGAQRVSMTNYVHIRIAMANASMAAAPCDLVVERVADAQGAVGKWKLSNFVLLQHVPKEVAEQAIAHQQDEPVL